HNAGWSITSSHMSGDVMTEVPSYERPTLIIAAMACHVGGIDPQHRGARGTERTQKNAVVAAKLDDEPPLWLGKIEQFLRDGLEVGDKRSVYGRRIRVLLEDPGWRHRVENLQQCAITAASQTQRKNFGGTGIVSRHEAARERHCTVVEDEIKLSACAHAATVAAGGRLGHVVRVVHFHTF